MVIVVYFAKSRPIYAYFRLVNIGHLEMNYIARSLRSGPVEGRGRGKREGREGDWGGEEREGGPATKTLVFALRPLIKNS